MKKSIIKPFVTITVVLALIGIAGCNKKTKTNKVTTNQITTNNVTTNKITTAHTHNFDAVLSFDELEHYYKCSGCSETKDNEEHTFGNEVIEGSKAVYSCTCGAKTEKDFGYKVTFVTDEHIKVLIYNTQDVTGAGVEANEAYSKDGETGMHDNSGEGQINYKLIIDEGYVIDSTIHSAKNYKNNKEYPDNVYRLTQITGDFTFTITSRLESAEIDGYAATFNLDSGITVTVFPTQDLAKDGVISTIAYARDSATGDIIKTGKPQINFVINEDAPAGYKYEIIVEGSYNNLKDISTIEFPNAYRITVIQSDLTISISLVEDVVTE